MPINHDLGKAGVHQGDGPRCGAACALQILTLLKCTKTKDTVGYVMSKTKTTGLVEFLGSTPRNIATFVLDRFNALNTTTETLTVYRLSSASTFLPWLQPLAASNGFYPKLTGVLGDDDIVLRFVASTGIAVTSHFVLETRRNGAVYIMNPSDSLPRPSRISFSNWLSSEPFKETGLDLVFRLA